MRLVTQNLEAEKGGHFIVCDCVCKHKACGHTQLSLFIAPFCIMVDHEQQEDFTDFACNLSRLYVCERYYTLSGIL